LCSATQYSVFLEEALMNTPTVVIKYGGHAMEDPALAAAFAQGLAALAQTGMRLVVVHGGGPQINSLLNRLCIESHFEKGLRVTDEATMEAVEMVLCGQVNKAVVSQFCQHGLRAVGISGKDACLLQAERISPLYGLVGEIKHVDARIVQTLLDGGFLPIIAPVACGKEGESLNINADTAAGALAGALHADYFVLVSDVPGVLDAEGKLIPKLNRARIQELKASNVIYGGMIPKVGSCLHALDAGCARALILDGRAPASLERYLQENAPLGTVVEN
jgi:acetylglutamate kinase